MSESDPPRPETPPEPQPPREPTPEPALEPKPTSPSSGRTLLYGCLSLAFAVPFGIVYLLLTAAFGLAAGAACAAAIVLGMFVLRREAKQPIIGTLAVGAAIAFAVHGTCLLIIAKSS